MLAIVVFDQGFGSFLSIVFGLLILGFIVGTIIRIILNKREEPTHFDDKIHTTSLSTLMEGVIGGNVRVAPSRFNASTIEGSDARKKHLRGVAGVFAYLLQELGCLNRANVNASRKAISSNFKTGNGTREAMLFLQRLMIKPPVDGAIYMQMVYTACTPKQMSALALSLCTLFGGRKLSKKEWTVVSRIFEGIHLPIHEKNHLQHKYYSDVDANDLDRSL